MKKAKAESSIHSIHNSNRLELRHVWNLFLLGRGELFAVLLRLLETRLRAPPTITTQNDVTEVSAPPTITS